MDELFSRRQTRKRAWLVEINWTGSAGNKFQRLIRIRLIREDGWIQQFTDFCPQPILLHYIFSSGSCPLKKILYPDCLNETKPFSSQRIYNYCLLSFLPIKQNWACFFPQARLANNFLPIFCNLFTQERSEMSHFYANYMQTLTQYFSFQKTANIVARSR